MTFGCGAKSNSFPGTVARICHCSFINPVSFRSSSLSFIGPARWVLKSTTSPLCSQTPSNLNHSFLSPLSTSVIGSIFLVEFPGQLRISLIILPAHPPLRLYLLVMTLLFPLLTDQEPSRSLLMMDLRYRAI